jgi:hypothetical protein
MQANKSAPKGVGSEKGHKKGVQNEVEAGKKAKNWEWLPANGGWSSGN